ncbi:hypothetical protein BH23ACT11_BH23ACT11_16190 [soil metagenome]
MRRTFISLASVLSIVVLMSFPLSDCAYACSCAASSGTPQERAEEAFAGAGAVFAGVVVDVSGPAPSTVMSSGDPVAVTFRVSEAWKGPPQETLEVTTATSSVSCGYEFQTGEEYLVYASRDLGVSLCSETKLLSDAAADLGVLGGGGELDEGYELPDTSGSTYGLLYLISGRTIWVIGLAAMVGALAVVWRFSQRS